MTTTFRPIFVARLLLMFGIWLGSACGENKGPDVTSSEGAATSVPESSPTAAPSSGRLALTVTGGRPVNSDIYTVNPDGSGLKRLTDLAGFDGAPVWSPDGRVIAFVSDRAGEPLRGGAGLYVMSADGSDQRPLVTDPKPQLGSQAWSPDGTTLAFTGETNAGWEIFTVRVAGGSGPNRLTSNDAYDDNPVWSPDGRRIAFVSRRDRISNIPNFSPQDIYVMNAGGSGQARINLGPEFHQAYSAAPAWSPDGRRIAFYAEGPGGGGIYAVDPDGANLVRLATGPGAVSRPAWSPDGHTIAFYSLETRWSIRLMEGDGSGQRLLTDQAVAPPNAPRPLAWSPDSRRIAFESQQPGGSEVFVINADGSGLARLLQSPPEGLLSSGSPSWSTR